MAEENQQQKISEEEPSESSTIPPTGVDIGVVPGQFFGRNNTPQKMEWPELVGSTAEEAEKKIKEVMPRARVQVVPPGCFVTMDYNTQRVRLYVDSTGKVVRPPRIG